MSWETQSWAARMRPGSASAKLVLLGFASCADANHCAFPSIDWLCEFSDLNRKTVISSVERLCAAGLMEDTGERRGRTKQVKVYRLAVNTVYRASGLTSDHATDPKVDGLKASGETVPKPEQFQKRNSSTFSRKESQNRDTEPFREPITPTETIVSVCPKGPKHTGSGSKGKDGGAKVASRSACPQPARARAATSRLPEDWTAPDVASLPTFERQAVETWPANAYQHVAEGFRLHFLAESGVRSVKRDWRAAFGKWLIGAHPRVLRDAKAGVTFSDMTAVVPASGAAAAPHWHPAVAREDENSLELRMTLAGEISERTFQHWLAPLAWVFLPGGRLHVIGSSSFALDWVRDNHGTTIDAAARKVIGSTYSGCVFTVERVNDGSGSQGNGAGEGTRGIIRQRGGSSAAGTSRDHGRRGAEVRA